MRAPLRRKNCRPRCCKESSGVAFGPPLLKGWGWFGRTDFSQTLIPAPQNLFRLIFFSSLLWGRVPGKVLHESLSPGFGGSRSKWQMARISSDLSVLSGCLEVRNQVAPNHPQFQMFLETQIPSSESAHQKRANLCHCGCESHCSLTKRDFSRFPCDRKSLANIFRSAKSVHHCAGMKWGTW